MLWIGDGYNEKTKKDSHGLQIFRSKTAVVFKVLCKSIYANHWLKSKIVLEEFVRLSVHNICFYLITEAATKVLIVKFWQF